MPVTPAAAELLKALSEVLARWGPWYLFGAQAVIAYGVPRLSADVDVTLRLTPDTPDQFVLEMRDAGFQIRVLDPEFVRRTRVMPFVHVSTGMPLDVVLAASGLEDEFLARARSLAIEGAKVPTIDPGDLIIAKVLARFPPQNRVPARGGVRHRPRRHRLRVVPDRRLPFGGRQPFGPAASRRRDVRPSPGRAPARGQLDSEFYLAWWWSNRWAVRVGFSHFLSEYRTARTLDSGADRFRHSANLGFVAVSFRP